MKSASELERELCEECPIYGQTGCDHCFEDALQYVIGMLEQEPTTKNDLGVDCVSRQAISGYIDYILSHGMGKKKSFDFIKKFVTNLPSVTPQEPKTGQYEKHTDHTDCIWYGSDSGCPVTCSQYRDGWNDAMDYIFKNGKGYQPYRHDV